MRQSRCITIACRGMAEFKPLSSESGRHDAVKKMNDLGHVPHPVVVCPVRARNHQRANARQDVGGPEERAVVGRALRCWAMISTPQVDVWSSIRQKPNAYERSSPSAPDVRV